MPTLEEQVKELTDRVLKLEKRLGVAPLSGPLSNFNMLMAGLDKRTLEVIFQGEGDRSLAYTVMGQDKGIIENMKGALSKKRWQRVYGEMKNLLAEGVTEGSVKSSQEELQRKVQKLEQMGEIVVASSGEGVGGRPWPWEIEVPKLDLRNWETKVLIPLEEKL